MIWKSIVRPRTTASPSARWSAISGFARKTVEMVSEVATIVCNLAMDVRDSYRPELHYMRGPGPKWRAKHVRYLPVYVHRARGGDVAAQPAERGARVSHENYR
jgi:hypothetical protein